MLISYEAKGVRCWTAPGWLENPKFVRLMLAQRSNTPGLTPHCLAPEVNGIKHKRKVGVKCCLLQSTGLKCPFCGGGSDRRHWKTGKDSRASHLPFQELFAGLAWGGYTRIHPEKPAKGLLSSVGCWRC
uniref:Uncharacterized protein n=1 Tax=Accipiter nisus TaxID=211598 RepID=A0A8B9N7S0_9AVES